MSGITRYLVLAMRTPSFDAGVIAPHQAFLQSLRERGQLLVTGGFSDSSGGAYVLENVSDLGAAEAIVAADPLSEGGSVLTIHEWNTR